MDPLEAFERSLKARKLVDDARVARVTEVATGIVEDAIERARNAEEPDPAEAWRPVFAPGEVADAAQRQSVEARNG